jgi:NADPH2:quinone reductase
MVMGANAAILGMLLFNASAEEEKIMHAALVAGLEMGIYCPVVGREFSLTEAPQAHLEILQPGAHGKIVLVP